MIGQPPKSTLFPSPTLSRPHNLGGKFEDVTAPAGLNEPNSKALGVVVFDFNNDGWPDIFVSNDTQSALLLGSFSPAGAVTSDRKNAQPEPQHLGTSHVGFRL